MALLLIKYAELILSTLPARKFTPIKGKIKKIIQSNQDVGKLANSIPHLMCTCALIQNIPSKSSSTTFSTMLMKLPPSNSTTKSLHLFCTRVAM